MINDDIQPFDSPVYVTRPFFPARAEFDARLDEIWESGWLTNNGPQHARLEAAMRHQLGTPHLSLFNNGTIALVTACQALRLSGEVITTPFTFPATPHVLSWNNIQPVFCDIDPVTMNIDPAGIAPLITPRTTGILGVHVYGTPFDTGAIQKIADNYGLKVVYDAAHAFGVQVAGQGIGNFGDVSMFSFHATKTFSTAEGGALAMRDEKLKARIDLLKNFGILDEESVIFPGINGKMNEIQAAFGLASLPLVEHEIRQRARLTKIYNESLAGLSGLRTPPDQAEHTRNFQYYVVRIDAARFGLSRDQMYEQLKRFNIFSRKYFHPLCSEYSCYRQFPSSHPDHLRVAHQVASEVLALPLHGGLTGHDVGRICHIVHHIYRNT